METTLNSGKSKQTHIVAIPYPGRGHVNALMNLCKLLVLKKPNHNNILISFIVTEEWLSFIESDHKPDNMRFLTIPNVIPSEIGRANDFPNFIKSVNTEMQAPTQRLLNLLDPPPQILVADTFMTWAVEIGSQMNIPVASFWPMSATAFSIFHHFQLLVQNGHFPAQLSERGSEIVDYIPGVLKTRLEDLPTFFSGDGLKVYNLALKSVYSVRKANFLLSSSVYELESKAIDALKQEFQFPVYTIGPCAPYFELERVPIITSSDDQSNYLQWLNSQEKDSVLYISQGSFLSVSNTQMDEIVAGIKNSGVRFLWVVRGDRDRFKDVDSDVGFVVSWCDQLRVLCHDSVGGFWTHCGWNSSLEAVFGGVPMITCPIFWDQIPNSKKIVEDWKVGVRVKGIGVGNLVMRDEIEEIVKRFMSPESVEMRKRVKGLRETCLKSVGNGGSSDLNLEAFFRDVLKE